MNTPNPSAPRLTIMSRFAFALRVQLQGYYQDPLSPPKSSVFNVGNKDPSSSPNCNPNFCYATCSCGRKFSPLTAITLPSSSVPPPPSSQDSASLSFRSARRSTTGNNGTSARYSVVQAELLNGTLSAHTLIAPEKYVGGPGLRHFSKTQVAWLGGGEEGHAEKVRGGRGAMRQQYTTHQYN